MRIDCVSRQCEKDEIEKVNKTLEQNKRRLFFKDKLILTSSALSQAYASLNAGKTDEAEKQFQALLKTYEKTLIMAHSPEPT